MKPTDKGNRMGTTVPPAALPPFSPRRQQATYRSEMYRGLMKAHAMSRTMMYHVFRTIARAEPGRLSRLTASTAK
jgi:hypothetical protein